MSNNGKMNPNALRAIFSALQESDNNDLQNGDKVKIFVDQIIGRRDYAHKQKSYQEFIEASRDRVFTVKIYERDGKQSLALVELLEEPKWLFWSGDLIKLKNGGVTNQ